MTLTVGSLFSGIGGIDLGLERAGMTVKWQCERDPYCRRVLAKHWPDVPCFEDITTTDWSSVERVDVLCGGYPCQPFSHAGRRQGTNDERHLWPYVAEAVRHLRPPWVLLENVPGHLSLGFGRVLGDLADLGYDAEWDCIPAAFVGASHLRYRVFIVAYPQGLARDGLQVLGLRRDAMLGAERESGGRDTAPAGRGGRWPLHEHPLCGGADGLPDRVDRLKSLGNAVVPQVAEWIGHRIVDVAA